jgi:hypothetical protein
MSENSEVKEKRNWVGIILVIIFLGSMGSNAFFYNHSQNLEKKANEMFIDLTDQVGKKQNEIDDLKKQIASIRDRDDVLKRDIQLYIKTTHPKVPTIVAKEISIQTVTLGRKYKVSPELIIGIIKVESSFNPMAVGPQTKYGHARGLMQVMPEWVKKLGLKNEYDFHEIDKGIESGIKVFKIHLEEGKGDISTGLYYYVNNDKEYVANVYAAMGKFVAFRSTINSENKLNVETDIDRNGDSKKLPDDKEKSLKNDVK